MVISISTKQKTMKDVIWFQIVVNFAYIWGKSACICSGLKSLKYSRCIPSLWRHLKLYFLKKIKLHVSSIEPVSIKLRTHRLGYKIMHSVQNVDSRRDSGINSRFDYQPLLGKWARAPPPVEIEPSMNMRTLCKGDILSCYVNWEIRYHWLNRLIDAINRETCKVHHLLQSFEVSNYHLFVISSANNRNIFLFYN